MLLASGPSARETATRVASLPDLETNRLFSRQFLKNGHSKVKSKYPQLTWGCFFFSTSAQKIHVRRHKILLLFLFSTQATDHSFLIVPTFEIFYLVFDSTWCLCTIVTIVLRASEKAKGGSCQIFTPQHGGKHQYLYYIELFNMLIFSSLFSFLQ